MEGIILEELEDKLIVLIKGGEFLKIDKPDYDVKVGQKIIIDTVKTEKEHLLKHFVSAAAIFMMLLTGGYGVYGYYVPYGYINIDINPSVEMGYNLYKKPINLQGLNEDGNKVIKKMGKFQRTSIEHVIDKIIEAAEEEKFIVNGKENTILITVTELNRKIDNEKLENKVKHSIQQRKIKANTIVIKGDKTIYQQAKKQGISPSKIILMNKTKPKTEQKIEHRIKPDKKEKQQIHIKQKRKQPKQKLKENKKEQIHSKEKTKKIEKQNKKEKQSKKQKKNKKEKHK